MSKIKITIQTLKGAKYDMEVKESDTIQEVKNRVESDLDLGDAASMKLIHAGKILKDTQTIEQCKIKPNDFLVVMVSAKSKKPAAPKAPSGGAPSTTPAAGSASTPAAAAPAPGPATSPAAASTPAAAPTSPPAAAPAASPSGAPGGTGATFQTAASTVVMGSELESTVVNLMALGYEHSKVVAALRAAFNNPDRAAEYLMSGIPEEKLLQMAAAGGGGGGAPRGPAAGPASGGARAPAGGAPAPAASGTAPAATGATGPAAGGAPAAAGGGGGVPPGLEQFAASPEFAQLRTLLQTNPQLLQLLLAQVAQSNPQLMQAMGQNPQALMAMLGGMGGAGGAGGAGGGAPGGGALPPGMTAQQAAALAAQQRGGTVISITQEEKNSIDNLERLGFSRQKALEAFLACDRNEELAANYLFEHSGMDETDDLGGDDAGTGH